MRKIGILGGLGPEATIDYYKEIINGFNRINDDGSLNYPEIIIYSVNMSVLINFFENQNYSKAVDYLSNCVNRIKDAGADFAALSANTPHLIFDQIQDNVDLPLISIIEACAGRAKKSNAKKCGLLGTKFTMQNDFYHKVFHKCDIEIVVPDNEQIDRINSIIFNELELGIFKEESKQEILGIVNDLIQKHGIDSIILGCTEFPLLFKESEYFGISFFNTTKIHVETIINESLNDH